jgi:prepilin-type N-terminal cleavage/methylation domain-containing protein
MTSKKKTAKNLLIEKGFTLIEVLVTLVILGIIAAIAVPSVFNLLDQAKEKVCLANRIELKNGYLTFIQIEGIQDSSEAFSEFLYRYDKELCPEHGVVIYEDGEVLCSIHSGSGEEEEGGDVPFL